VLQGTSASSRVHPTTRSGEGEHRARAEARASGQAARVGRLVVVCSATRQRMLWLWHVSSSNSRSQRAPCRAVLRCGGGVCPAPVRWRQSGPNRWPHQRSEHPRFNSRTGAGSWSLGSRFAAGRSGRQHSGFPSRRRCWSAGAWQSGVLACAPPQQASG
jgi:hypothetical protein